jgi:hypothetical protein
LAVADVTGEDVVDIALRGFSLVEDFCCEASVREHETSPRLIDWDSALPGATMTFAEVD